MKNQKLVFMAQQAQQLLSHQGSSRGDSVAKASADPNSAHGSSVKRTSEPPKNQMKSGTFSEHGRAAVEFQVRGEKKIPQEKSKQRLPAERAHRPGVPADLEHAMYQTFTHAPNEGEQPAEGRTASLRHPHDQALSQGNELENRGRYGQDLAAVVNNSAEAQTVTPDYDKRTSTHMTAQVKNETPEEPLHKIDSSRSPVQGDNKLVILQTDGKKKTSTFEQALNQSLQSSNSKSPIEAGNEDALNVGQHCYSPTVLAQGAIVAPNPQNKTAELAQGHGDLQAVLKANLHLKNPVDVQMGGFTCQAEALTLRSDEKLHGHQIAQMFESPGTVKFMDTKKNSPEHYASTKRRNKGSTSSQKQISAEQEHLQQIPAHSIAKIQVKKKNAGGKTITLNKISMAKPKRAAPSFALIELEHTRDLMIGSKPLRLFPASKSPRAAAQYHPPIIVSANKSKHSGEPYSAESDASSEQKVHDFLSKIDWSQAIRAMENEAPSKYAVRIDEMKKEARQYLLRRSSRIQDPKVIQQYKEIIEEKKIKAAKKKLKNDSDSEAFDLSQDESLKDIFVAWHQIKMRTAHLRAQEDEAKNKKPRRQRNSPGRREESNRPSKQSPRKGLSLAKREDTVLQQIDEREKRIAEADKAISMTSSKLQNDILFRHKRDDLKKVSELEDVQTVTADLKSHGAPGVLSELMSYRGQQRINNSKLSHFSPTSLENTKQDVSRAGITTPNNQKDFEKLDIKRKTYSVSKENEKKSGTMLAPLDVKISSKEDDSDGTAENKININTQPEQKITLVKNIRTDEGPMTPHEIPDQEVKQSMFIRSKFSETANHKTEETSPFMASDGHVPIVRPATRPHHESSVDVSQTGAYQTQHSSFEKERKTVTLKGNQQDKHTQIVGGLQPQHVQINIRADSKASPTAAASFGDVIIRQSDLGKVAGGTQDSTDKNPLLKNVETTEQISSHRDVLQASQRAIQRRDVPCNSSYVSIEQKVSEFPNTITVVNNSKGPYDVMSSELFMQQNMLQLDHERQEQMFRSIQLMQQSLQDKEAQRNKRIKQQNQDIPLQHNNSSTSHQIKSNILQHYLQVPKMPINTADELQRRLSSVMSSDPKVHNVHPQVHIINSQSTVVADQQLPRYLFNDLDIHQKLEIQKNLQKLYERFQLKNMNAHYRRQKMPFSHFKHPNQKGKAGNGMNKDGMKQRTSRSFTKRRSSYEQQMVSTMAGTMAGPPDYLKGGAKNANARSKQPAMLTQRPSLERSEPDTARNIIPAPKQRGFPLSAEEHAEVKIKKRKEGEASQSKKDIQMQDGFQNRLIKNKIQQKLAQDDDALAVWPDEQDKNQQVTESDVDKMNDLKSIGAAQTEPELPNMVSHSQVQQNIKNAVTEYEDPKSHTEIESNIELMQNQMQNLIEIYNKNKDILRQMRTRNMQKHYQNRQLKRSFNADTRRSFDESAPDAYGSIGFRQNQLQNMSPMQRELLEQEIAIQNKQDELRQTLLKNQKKNLQIQQRLQQKLDLSRQQLGEFASKNSSAPPRSSTEFPAQRPPMHTAVAAQLPPQSAKEKILHRTTNAILHKSPVLVERLSEAHRSHGAARTGNYYHQIQHNILQNKQKKLKILENIYKKLDLLNHNNIALADTSYVVPANRILSTHPFPGSPLASSRTSPRLDPKASRVQQLAKENSSFDLYINEQSPQQLNRRPDLDGQDKELNVPKIKHLQRSKQEYKKQLNENFMHSSQNNDSEMGATPDEEHRYNKIFEKYMMTRSGQLVQNGQRQVPQIVMNKYKDDHTIDLPKVKKSQRQSHMIADVLEQEFQRQRSRGDANGDYEEGDFNENIQSQHQAYEDNNVLSAKTVGSGQIEGNQNDEATKDVEDTKEQAQNEGSDVGDKMLESNSNIENLLNQELTADGNRSRAAEGKHVNVNIGQSVGSQHYESAVGMHVDDVSPEQSPLLKKQRDQGEMVNSTDEALMSPTIDAKEISINEEILIHRNELESITSYVAQKGRTVFQQFKTLLESQTPHNVKILFRDINAILSNELDARQDLQMKAEVEEPFLEIQGEQVDIGSSSAVMTEHAAKLNMIKELERTFLKFNSPKKENLDRGRQSLDRLFRSPSRQKEVTSAMTNFGTPGSSQENLQAQKAKATRPSADSKGSGLVSYTARSPRDASAMDTTQLLKLASKSPRLSGRMRNNSGRSSATERSFAGRLEMEQFMQNFLSYYRDLKSIEKLRNMVSETDDQQVHAQQKGQSLQSEMYESILEDLQKLLLLDIQSMLDVTNEDIKNTLEDQQQDRQRHKAPTKFAQIDSDTLYLAQTHIAEKNLDVDLYFKQRQKAQSDIYIRHVQRLMDEAKREREGEIKGHQESLIQQGKLHKDDIESAPQHPKIPLELQLNEHQLLHEDINDIKNLDQDVTISNQEKNEMRAQFKELKFKKLLEKREQRVNEELSSGRSKYGSRLDICTLENVKEDKDGELDVNNREFDETHASYNDYAQASFAKPSGREIGAATPLQENILTNESLCKLLKQKETADKKANEMRNGYEMSVQKLAKVNSIEQDSIYSAVPSNPNVNPYQPSASQNYAEKSAGEAPDAEKIMTRQYFRHGGRIRAKSNAVGNQTAPGGDRSRLKKLRVGAQAATENLSKIQIRADQTSHLPSTPVSGVGYPQSKPTQDKTESMNGLIQRGNLRFKKILQFENQVVKKADVVDYQDNERLQSMRQNYQESTTKSLQADINLNRTPITATGSLLSRGKSSNESTSRYLAKDSLSHARKFMQTASESADRTSSTKNVHKQQNTQLIQDFKKSMMSKKTQLGDLINQAYQCDGQCLDETSLLSYGNQILNLRQDHSKRDQDYISFIQSGEPLLPALRLALSEQLKQNVEEKEKSKKPKHEQQAEAEGAGDRPLTQKEKEQLEQRRQKLKGLQDINQFQLELYYQKLEMLEKTSVPAIFKDRSATMTQQEVIRTNLNNLVNGAPIFLPSKARQELGSRGGSSSLHSRKYSVPLKAEGNMLGYASVEGARESTSLLQSKLSGNQGLDSYKQSYFERIMGKSSMPPHLCSTQNEDATLSKLKVSQLDRTSGSTLHKLTHSPFGHSDNMSVVKGVHAIQRSEQIELEDEPRSKFLKDAKAPESQRTAALSSSNWPKHAGDDLDMRAPFKKSVMDEIIEKTTVNSSARDSGIQHHAGKRHTLDYLPLSKHKRYQSVNTRSYERRTFYESHVESGEGSRLRRYDEMIKKMQSKQLSKMNQKIKIKGHLEKFEGLTQSEMIKTVPKMRDYKQESARILHERFNPALIKLQEQQAKEQQRKEQQQVFDYFKNNLERLDL